MPSKKIFTSVILGSLMIIPLVVSLPHGFLKVTAKTNSNNLKAKKTAANNYRHLQKYTSVVPNVKNNFHTFQQQNLFANISLLVKGDNYKGGFGYSFNTRSSFYNSEQQLSQLNTKIDRNTQKRITVAGSELLNLEVKINLSKQKWARLSLVNQPIALNFSIVNPTSVQFQIVAKGHQNNPTINLLEAYQNRNSTVVHYVNIGSYDVYNMNKNTGSWFKQYTVMTLVVGTAVLICLFAVVLTISYFGYRAYKLGLENSENLVVGNATSQLANENENFITGSFTGDANSDYQLEAANHDMVDTQDNFSTDDQINELTSSPTNPPPPYNPYDNSSNLVTSDAEITTPPTDAPPAYNLYDHNAPASDVISDNNNGLPTNSDSEISLPNYSEETTANNYWPPSYFSTIDEEYFLFSHSSLY